MPSYGTHVSVNLFLGLPLSLAAMKYMAQLSSIETIAFSTAFVYGTFFLHVPILGTLTRIAWLAGLCYLAHDLFNEEIPYFLFAMIGLAVAGLIHLTLDQVTP